ncbi:MAG: hypothetical protein AAGF85_09905 [Bacteroidota bacterium]
MSFPATFLRGHVTLDRQTIEVIEESRRYLVSCLAGSPRLKALPVTAGTESSESVSCILYSTDSLKRLSIHLAILAKLSGEALVKSFSEHL